MTPSRERALRAELDAIDAELAQIIEDCRAGATPPERAAIDRRLQSIVEDKKRLAGSAGATRSVDAFYETRVASPDAVTVARLRRMGLAR